jgi:hypothetical protein
MLNIDLVHNKLYLFLFFSSFYLSLKFRDQNSTSTVQEEAGLVPQASAKLENGAPSAMEISSIDPSPDPAQAGATCTGAAPMEPKECEDDSATSEDPQSTAILSTPSYLTYGLAPQSHVNQIEKSESHSQACAVSLNLDATKIPLLSHFGFCFTGIFFDSTILFFLKHAGELRIIALRRKDQSKEPLQTHTCAQRH